MPFISRSTTASDRYVKYKSVLLGLGLVFLLVGIRTEERWPVWVGVVLLGLAFLMRFLPGSTMARGSSDPDGSDDEAE